MTAPAPLEVRRALRFWAACDVAYALALSFVLLRFVPFKWPLAHALLLVYLGAHLPSAPGLWRGHRWAWRLALVVSVVGVLLGICAVGGLLASWAYLRGVYGSFGVGASLVSLLIAATAFQALGLYPGLRLRTLLRRDVRAHMLGGRGVAVAVGVAAGVWLGLAVGLAQRHALADRPALSTATAEASVRWLRAALHDDAAGAPPQGPAGASLLFASAYLDGRLIARAGAEAASHAEALGQLRDQLRSNETLREARHTRLKLDRALGVAPVLSQPRFAEALGFEPGRDGLRVRKGRTTEALLPDDMIAADVYGSTPLLPFLEEVRLGVSPSWIRQRLGMTDAQALERFAVESWMECDEGRVCRVERGVVQVPPFDSKRAAIAAGRFMLRQLQPDGTFTYVYLPWKDATAPAGYNVARHAGTAYTLAMLAPLDREVDLLAGSERALMWLLDRAAPVCGGHLCVQEGNVAKVGNNALSLLALATYQANSNDMRWQPRIASLARFLVSLQRPNGDLVPAFLAAEGQPATNMRPQMFATEEAAFALARAGRLLDDEHLRQASARAIDFLTVGKYRDFLGRFTYGADSWTCMAAAELPRPLVRPQWVDFCLGYADFLARMQFAPGEHDPAFEGHYGFTHLLVPQAPAAAGFAEALTFTLALARDHGRDTSVLTKQVRAALDALKRDQIRPGNDYLVQAPAQAHGGIRRSVVQSEIRIDFVQHAAAALAQGHALGI